jgi:hypothetical protein
LGVSRLYTTQRLLDMCSSGKSSEVSDEN